MRYHIEKLKLFIFSILLLTIYASTCNAQQLKLVEYHTILSGAQQTKSYFPLLEGKKIAVVTNQSGNIGNIHLVDSLLSAGMQLVKVFSPEHGFRGDQDAGKHINNEIDEITKLLLVSLYGKNKKPTPNDLKGIEVVLFDLQDVGLRFYTYISTLTYVMEACAEEGIPVVVLDRPNPNGFYIDGPVLKPEHRSFVGMHPIPVVYGLTIGEYALMVKGEKWIEHAESIKLTVVPLKGYARNTIVQLAVKPSPNLPNWESVYLYPSLCFFEGTSVSVGRGTETPFQIYGHPNLPEGNASFTPRSVKGASLNPPFKDITCYGKDLRSYAQDFQNHEKKIKLTWLIDAYNHLKDEDVFFNNYFNTLAGNAELRQQIESGMSEASIRKSWEDDIKAYKKIRVKYILYPDPPYFSEY